MGGDGGGSDRINIDYADLMTEQQKLVLDQMLRGAVSAVQGFQLGTPYPGPKKKGYGTSIFNIAGGGTPYAGLPTDEPTGPKDDPFDPEELSRMMPPAGGAAPPGAIRPNVQNILQNMDAFFQGRQGGGGMPPNPAMRYGSTAMPNLYTKPFTSPYTQLLTGNFPRGG